MDQKQFSNWGNFSSLLIGGDKDWPSPLTTEHAWKSPALQVEWFPSTLLHE